MTPALRKAAPWSAGRPAFLIHAIPVFRKAGMPLLLLGASALAGCATHTPPPEISYDNAAPAVQAADPPKPVQVVELPKPLPLPGQLKPIGRDGKPEPEAADPTVRATAVLTDGDVHVPDARWPFELLWLLPPGASPTFAPPAGQVLRMTDGATTT